MSEPPIDTIRRVYDSWAQGDFNAGTELFDEASAFILNPEFPDAGIYIGPDELERYMRGFLEPWEQLTVTCLELSAVGDTVVAEVHQSGKGELSGAVTGFRYFQLWTFRGGTALRLQNVMSRAEADAAVGASATRST